MADRGTNDSLYGTDVWREAIERRLRERAVLAEAERDRYREALDQIRAVADDRRNSNELVGNVARSVLAALSDPPEQKGDGR